jgi:glycosyltransferase involved in cell wall biosynthesis
VEPIQNAVLRGHPIDWALIVLFLFLFLLHLVYLLFFVLRAAYYKHVAAGEKVPLSLILILNNEEENIDTNLASLLESKENGYEVVAVDNYSQDESVARLNALKSRYPQLRVSSLKQYTLHSIKMAQNIAMKAAQYDWVTVIPPSAGNLQNGWLNEAGMRLNNGAQTVVNYSNVVPAASFFNLLLRVESFFQQIKSFGFIANGLPFVLSQENVVFQKQLYFNEGGYRGMISEPFAQLELVINSFIRKGPVSMVLSHESAIHMKEDVSRKDYLELVKKEMNIRKHLPFGTRLLLVIFEWMFLLFVPVTALLILRVPAAWPVIVGMVICLITCNLLIIKKLLSRLKEYKLLLPSLLIALFLPFLKIAFRVRYFNYGRKKEWKIGN